MATCMHTASLRHSSNCPSTQVGCTSIWYFFNLQIAAPLWSGRCWPLARQQGPGHDTLTAFYKVSTPCFLTFVSDSEMTISPRPISTSYSQPFSADPSTRHIGNSCCGTRQRHYCTRQRTIGKISSVKSSLPSVSESLRKKKVTVTAGF